MKYCRLAGVTTIASALAGSILGCGNSGTTGGSAGAAQAGAAAGGAPGAGGSPAAAGTPAAGGSPATAGATGTGGDTASGGSTGNGGTSSGGTTGTGGRGGAAGSGAAGAGTGGRGGAPAAGGGGGSSTAGRGGASSSAGASGNPGAGGGGNTSPMMTFFATSRGMGDGGNLGGLDGADAFCKMLANAVSPALGAKTWHAYLSTATVNARTRIGDGPWRNAAGVIIANNLADLHDQLPANAALNATWPVGSATIALDERGNPVPITGPNVHDILTGSNTDGTAAANTCNNWTSNAMNVTGQVGHTNRMGNGVPSWNSTHATSGCAQPTAPMNQMGTVSSGGGRGSIYCFALP